jgi:hypothetical protein
MGYERQVSRVFRCLSCKEDITIEGEFSCMTPNPKCKFCGELTKFIFYTEPRDEIRDIEPEEAPTPAEIPVGVLIPIVMEPRPVPVPVKRFTPVKKKWYSKWYRKLSYKKEG